MNNKVVTFPVEDKKRRAATLQGRMYDVNEETGKNSDSKQQIMSLECSTLEHPSFSTISDLIGLIYIACN